jgi:hypothetical protein
MTYKDLSRGWWKASMSMSFKLFPAKFLSSRTTRAQYKEKKIKFEKQIFWWQLTNLPERSCVGKPWVLFWLRRCDWGPWTKKKGQDKKINVIVFYELKKNMRINGDRLFWVYFFISALCLLSGIFITPSDKIFTVNRLASWFALYSSPLDWKRNIPSLSQYRPRINIAYNILVALLC